VLLTEAELASLRALSESAGVSVQRYLIEAAMSGSADDAASRRRAVVDVQASRVVLKGVSNNLNQLTKWANANHALPDRLDSLVDDLAQAVATVEQTASELRTAFGLNQQSRGGEEGRASS
jgi:ABC-type transporter Mla subunit MlaD